MEEFVLGQETGKVTVLLDKGGRQRIRIGVYYGEGGEKPDERVYLYPEEMNRLVEWWQAQNLNSR